MRVTYNWLKQYMDLSDVTPERLAEEMTRSGLEVEGIETTGASEISVKHFGFDAKGSDSLEVVDIDAIMEDKE